MSEHKWQENILQFLLTFSLTLISPLHPLISSFSLFSLYNTEIDLNLSPALCSLLLYDTKVMWHPLCHQPESFSIWYIVWIIKARVITGSHLNSINAAFSLTTFPVQLRFSSGDYNPSLLHSSPLPFRCSVQFSWGPYLTFTYS